MANNIYRQQTGSKVITNRKTGQSSIIEKFCHNCSCFVSEQQAQIQNNKTIKYNCRKLCCDGYLSSKINSNETIHFQCISHTCKARLHISIKRHHLWMVKEHSHGGIVARVCASMTNAYKVGNTIFISNLCVSDHKRGKQKGKQLERGNCSMARCPSFAKLFLWAVGGATAASPSTRALGGNSEPLLMGKGGRLSSATDTGGLSLLSWVLTCLLLKPPSP